MTHPVLVSIVVPTYNDAPEHLRQAVKSALGQSIESVEVILVDDGSTQLDTITTVDELAADERVTLVRQKNAGAAHAMNSGVAASSGLYVMTLGGDDWINDTFVESCLALMSEHVAFVYSEINYFWDGGRPSQRGLPPLELDLASFMSGNRVAATALLRRADWLRLGGLVTAQLAFEDYDLWVRLLASSPGQRAVLAPRAMLHYRQRPGSRSSIAPKTERTKVTRELMAKSADLKVLRRLLFAAWDRIDEYAVADAAQKERISVWEKRIAPIRRLKQKIKR